VRTVEAVKYGTTRLVQRYVANPRNEFMSSNRLQYLAANPYDIPGFFISIAGSYSRGGDQTFAGNGFMTRENPTDNLFKRLPQEMKLLILTFLSKKDVANLRLVSRSFHHFPAVYFRWLIDEEMPWFWEVKELEDMDVEYLGRLDDAREHTRGRRNINWLKLYSHLRILEQTMLGVRNRARIYKVVSQIVFRIGRLRERDASGKYYLEGSGGKLEFVDPSDDPATGGHCPRCQDYRVGR
jgi:hypothetical protein